MNSLAFLIIEDVLTRHETLWFALRDIFPDENVTIIPKYDNPCERWTYARELIESVPAKAQLIVLADLALKGNDPNDAKAGVIECRRLHQLRPDATFIAVTAFERVIQETPDAEGLFALVLDKQDPVWNQGQIAIAAYLRNKVHAVRSQSTEPAIVEDTVQTSPTTLSTKISKLVFVSHSHDDADLATAVVDLLGSSLHLRRSDFLCTSADGSGLAGGSNTSNELRQQIASATSFISLLTPKALASSYVLFELGARWGMGQAHIPLLARGNNASGLPGPLKETIALDISQEAKVIQLVLDMSVLLARPPEPTNAYFDKVQIVTHLARTPFSPR
jgi:hypothetical protein